jgi:hypothetical protein
MCSIAASHVCSCGRRPHSKFCDYDHHLLVEGASLVSLKCFWMSLTGGREEGPQLKRARHRCSEELGPTTTFPSQSTTMPDSGCASEKAAASALSLPALKATSFTGDKSFYCHNFVCPLAALLSEPFLQPLMQQPKMVYTGMIENLDLQKGMVQLYLS